MDRRLWFAWWMILSVLALKYKTLTGQAFLAGTVLVFWLSKPRGLLNFFRVVAPFLVFVTVVELPAGGFGKAAIFALRMFVLLGSSALVMSMGNSRFVETMRNIRIEKWSTATELFTYLLGQSLLTVPSVGLEVSRLQEIQRARGIDTTGSVVQKAKKAVGLAIPLFEAMLDRIRYQGLSHEVLGYDPFAKRTVYNQLHFTRVDWLVLGFMLVLSILAFTLKL